MDGPAQCSHLGRSSEPPVRSRAQDPQLGPAFQFGLGCPSVGPRHCSFFLWLSSLVDVCCSPQVHVEKLRPTGVAGTCPWGGAEAGSPATRLSRLSQQVCPTLSGDRTKIFPAPHALDLSCACAACNPEGSSFSDALAAGGCRSSLPWASSCLFHPGLKAEGSDGAFLSLSF